MNAHNPENSDELCGRGRGRWKAASTFCCYQEPWICWGFFCVAHSSMRQTSCVGISPSKVHY